MRGSRAGACSTASSRRAALPSTIFIGEGCGAGLAPTNDRLTMIVGGWPLAQYETRKHDHEKNYHSLVEGLPALAERVRGARIESRVFGGATPSFFRKPFGRGWALVGDAGYIKDPITAQGMTDAFRDAELLATAVHEWRSGARSFDLDALIRAMLAVDPARRPDAAEVREASRRLYPVLPRSRAVEAPMPKPSPASLRLGSIATKVRARMTHVPA